MLRKTAVKWEVFLSWLSWRNSKVWLTCHEWYKAMDRKPLRLSMEMWFRRKLGASINIFVFANPGIWEGSGCMHEECQESDYKSKFPKQINYWMTIQIVKAIFHLLNIYCVFTLAKSLSKYGSNLIYRKSVPTVVWDIICWGELPFQSIRKFWDYLHVISKVSAYISEAHSVVKDWFIITRNLILSDNSKVVW